LLGNHFDVGDIRELAAFLAEFDPDNPERSIPILEKLLAMQGVGPNIARILATEMPTLEMRKLLARPTLAVELLRTYPADLERKATRSSLRRALGTPHGESGGGTRLGAFWMHHILFADVWRDVHPREYGYRARAWFPDKM
jgi:hypothetical protein